MELLENQLKALDVEINVERNHDVNAYPKWAKGMAGFTVYLKRGTRETHTPYFKGKGLGYENPTLSEVIVSLMADRATIQTSSDFEDWADNLGYNSDSITDRNTYELCQTTTNRLESMFNEHELKLIGHLVDCEA